jgi:hypothetical protein
MEEKGSACQGLVGKTEAKRDFLEDGMDESLVLQIRKQGVNFQRVCSAVVLISFLCMLATICSAKQI